MKERKISLLLFIVINIYLLFLIPYSPINQYTPYFSDIAVYLNTGKEILNGKVMYTEIFDHKGPLLPLIFTIPHLFGNVDMMMFILTLVLLNMIFIFSYKTIKYFTGNQILISTILILQAISLYYFNYFMLFGPEIFALLTTTYITYWILTKKYKNPTNTQLIVCGILTAMMFWIKFTYITYIGMIFLFFLYTKIKEKSFNYKDILIPAIGFLIITIPLIIYLVANNALIEMFNIYFVLNSKYKNTEPFLINSNFILLLITLISSFIYNLKNKNIEHIAILIVNFILVFFVFIMPKNNWIHLYLPFISILPMLFTIKINLNKLLQKIILILLILILIMISITNLIQFNILNKNNVSNLYTPIIQKIENNSKIMVLSGDVITKDIKSFNYKYFYFPSFIYSQFSEFYDSIHNDIKDKNVDYVITRITDNLIGLNSRCKSDILTLNKVNDITEDLFENYEIIEKIDEYVLFKVKND